MMSSFLHSMKIPFRIAAVAFAIATLSSCETYKTKRVVFKNHPIALYVVSKVVDEERVDYSVKFRNIGKEVLSFDYTLSDEQGVPHVDSEGPNSGLVENLYPGSEAEVPNPTKNMTIHATLGSVTYGKKAKNELSAIYKPSLSTGPAMPEIPLLLGSPPPAPEPIQ
jgi:hypothetical protein